MIRLERDRARIVAQFTGEARLGKHLEILELQKLGPIASKEFDSDHWKRAKPQIKAESHGKCAYCEADTGVVAHGDVEHFRPKNIYWWLAYCYDNYLYSCQICNQSFKGNKFPVSSTLLPAPRVRANSSARTLARLAQSMAPDPLDEEQVEAFLTATWNEDADLIDPYLEDPEEILEYEEDLVLQEVVVKIAAGSHNRAKRQRALDEVYGLNREELRRLRFQDFKILKVLGSVYEADSTNVPVADVIRGMMSATHRFAGMARYYVKYRWELDIEAP